MTKISHGWAGPSLEARIAAHVQAWQKIKPLGSKRIVAALPFVTISREFGCEGRLLAQRLVEILNERCRPSIPWVAYDQEVLDKVAGDLHLQREIIESMDGRRRDEMTELFDSILNKKIDDGLVFRKMAEVVRSLANHGHSVLVGRGSHLIAQDLKTGLNVRLEAPYDWRVHRAAAELNLTQREAKIMVEQRQRERDHFMNTFFFHDSNHPFHHDLVIDNSRFNLAQVAEIVFTALSARFGEALVGA